MLLSGVTLQRGGGCLTCQHQGQLDQRGRGQGPADSRRGAGRGSHVPGRSGGGEEVRAPPWRKATPGCPSDREAVAPLRAGPSRSCKGLRPAGEQLTCAHAARTSVHPHAHARHKCSPRGWFQATNRLTTGSGHSSARSRWPADRENRSVQPRPPGPTAPPAPRTPCPIQAGVFVLGRRPGLAHPGKFAGAPAAPTAAWWGRGGSVPVAHPASPTRTPPRLRLIQEKLQTLARKPLLLQTWLRPPTHGSTAGGGWREPVRPGDALGSAGSQAPWTPVPVGLCPEL